MLLENTLFGTVDRVQVAIDRLKQFEPAEGYYLAFSGGKDSVVIKALADMSGVKHDAHYSETTIDPPELVRFIKERHPDVHIDRPKKSFFQLILTQGYPTRQARWCCKLLKERGGEGRTVITGVRWAESAQRKTRQMVESCSRQGKHFLHVIIDWSDADVWEFIHEHSVPYCKLYDEGWHRIGCLFCPMNTDRMKHAKLYPKYTAALIKAFERRYEYATERDLTMVSKFESGEEAFWWWLGEHEKPRHDEPGLIFE